MAQAQTAPDATVRVRLLGSAPPSQIQVTLGTPGTLWIDGVSQGAVSSGTLVSIARTGSAVRVQMGGTDLSGREVRLDAPEIRVQAGPIDRHYPTRLIVRAQGRALHLVNHAPMETYVASVVASEFGFSAIEGAKAQAVLARTYAARRAVATRDYDLDDDQSAQVYRGTGTITDVSARAARETAGQVLLYRGALAEATYFSSSGGHTANNESVWSGPPVPYLRGVPDPYDAAAPDHSWRTTASRRTILRALSARFGGSVNDIEVAEGSRNGRVLRVRLVGGRTASVTGTQFREAVNAAAGARTVRSTRFTISAEGDQFVFAGGGFGHGVGMSQYGALGQSQAGRGYREILAHYFVGTDVAGESPLLASSEPMAGRPSAAIPREPVSALRTHYRPPSGRRWPEPRRLVETERPEVVAPAATAPAPAPATRRARRTAW